MSHQEPRHNLPARLTSFVGREHELPEVTRLLGDARLVTLMGAPGVGKTRLALEIARGMVGTFADGVWLVELAALAEQALVPQAVATALGIPERPGRPLDITLAERLRARPILLLLDNCEHLVEACASLVQVLLRACPELRVLATSREPLNIEGETTWSVPPLATPGAGELAPGREAVSDLLDYAAIRLFTERARAALPSFSLTERNAPSVARVCARLDGIPLALELAAVRVRTLTVEQVEARLDDRFRLLTVGGRVGLPHHRTLRALLDWSHALLSEPEQALLRRLSIFVGGWTLEAAEGVCADPGAGPAGRAGPDPTGPPLAHGPSLARDSIVDLLSALVEKSLVLADQRGPAVRYRLLETLRAYGRERLDQASEGVDLGERHRDWFLSFAERGDQELQGPDHLTWLDRLETEHDNLRAALSWSRDHPGDPHPGLRLVGALATFWERRGYATEAVGWLEMALNASVDLSTAPRAKALSGLGRLAGYNGDTERPLALHHEALALYRELGDATGQARSLRSLGLLATSRGEYERARSLLEESCSLFRALGDEREAHLVLLALGSVARCLGDDARATQFLSAGLARLRALGDRRSRSSMAPGLLHLGLIACGQGDLARAAALLEEGLALCREVGDPRAIGWLLSGLAAVACENDEPERAIGLYRDSLACHLDGGHRSGMAASLEGLARLALRQRQLVRATRLFGAAATLREGTSRARPPVERVQLDEDLARIKDALGEAAFLACWAEGRRMSLGEAIAFGADPAPSSAPLSTAGETGSASAATPPASRRGSAADALTAREREVAALVAHGLTNRQIAAELVISERTVDGHVANILSRLGFSTRAQVAAWTVRQGLDSSVSP